MTMGDLATRLDQLAREELPPSSVLAADEQFTKFAGAGVVFAEYVQERAAAAARFLQELHRSTLLSDPGQLHMDFVLLYPALRGALENSAAVTWLLRPTDRIQRLERFLRIMRRDINQFVTNNRRLAAIDTTLPIPRALFDRLAAHMETEGPVANDYLDQAATVMGISRAASRAQVLTATPITDVYDGGSLTHVVWRFLSDLTHYSFTTMKNQDIVETETGQPARAGTLNIFTTTVVQAARDAATELEQSVRAAQGRGLHGLNLTELNATVRSPGSARIGMLACCPWENPRVGVRQSGVRSAVYRIRTELAVPRTPGRPRRPDRSGAGATRTRSDGCR